jgi:hypothetical protein
MRIYIFSNETGRRIDCYDGADNSDCEEWAAAHYGSNDYSWGYTDGSISTGDTRRARNLE